MNDADRLAQLFPCSRYVTLFPAGMPRRACARRQVEMKREGKAWVPRKPFCALGACPLAAETRAALAGIRMEPCSKCGGALIGEERCSTCQEAAAEHAVPRRTPPAPPPQDRIWSGEVPNTPLAGPPATSPHTGYRPAIEPHPYTMTDPKLAALAAKRKREQAAAASSFEVEKEEVHPEPQHQPPAQPAQEKTMEPKKPTRKPKDCCGSKGSRCFSGCKGAAKSAPKKAAPAPARKARPAAANEASARVTPEQLAALTNDDLEQGIVDFRDELVRRQADAERTARELAERLARVDRREAA